MKANLTLSASLSLLFLILPIVVDAKLSDTQRTAINEIELVMQSYNKMSISTNTPIKKTIEKDLKNNVKKSVNDKTIVAIIEKKKSTDSVIKKKTVKSKQAKQNSNVSYCLNADYDKLAKRALKYQKFIATHSSKYEVSESLIKAIITAESCFDERAESPKGAQGLMQLMPATGKRFGTTDRFDVNLNIKAGTRYLKFLLEYYDDDLLNTIAAYNAGEGAVDKYNGIPPYKETKKYVYKVAALYKLYSQGGGVISQPSLATSSFSESVFVPRAMPRSRFSPYKNRRRNISKGNCSNKTSTRLRKSTLVESGDGVWQRIYIASKGENLMRVMQKTGIHKTKLMQMNGLNSRARLNKGQRLLVWECRK